MNDTNLRLARAAAAAIAAALCSGFIFPKKYEQPQPGESAARLAISKHQGEIDTPSPMEPTRYFAAFDNPSCDKGKRGGFLGSLSHRTGGVIGKLIASEDESRKEFRIAADEPFYLKVKAQVVTDSRRRAFKMRTCTNLVTFTPLNGHRYEAQQIATDDRCLLVVVDDDTKRVPDDFEIVPVAGACHED